MGNKAALGAIFSKKDVRDYKAVCCTLQENEFPKEFKLELVRVKYQGYVGSCVAHALSTVVEYHNSKQLNDETEMSVGFIYGNRNNSLHKGEGMVTRDALASLKNYGDVTKEQFPENEEVPNIINKFQDRLSSLYDSAQPFRISTYAKLTSESDIKTALMNNGPVIIAIDWYKDMKVKNGVLTSSFDKSLKSGGHCMVIYGWDYRGWKVQNSWGIWWGTKGCAVIPYDMKIREFWTVTDDIIEGMDIKKPFSSKIGKIIAMIINEVLSLFSRNK